MYLPDVNILLSLVFEAHIHHRTVSEWFDTVSDLSFRICRRVQSDFLVCASQNALFQDDALTPTEAWRCYHALIEDGRFEFLPEPVGTEQMWRRLTRFFDDDPSQWQKSYLAAIAVVEDITVVSFDPSYRKVPMLRVVSPVPSTTEDQSRQE